MWWWQVEGGCSDCNGGGTGGDDGCNRGYIDVKGYSVCDVGCNIGGSGGGGGGGCNIGGSGGGGGGGCNIGGSGGGGCRIKELIVSICIMLYLCDAI